MNYINNLIRHRELFYFLSWRDIRARYKQALLGFVWVLLQPLLLMALFTILGKILSISSEGVPRPIFYYSAALPWTFFSNAVTQGSSSLVSNSSLVRQIYFPRELIPWSKILTATFDFLVAFIIFIGLFLLYRISPTWNILYLPLLIVLQILFMLPVTLIMAGLNVAFRDIQLVVGFLLLLWMYASPIIYPLNSIPVRLQTFYLLNPMAGLIDSYRRIMVYGLPPNFKGLAIGVVVSTVLFIVTYYSFKRAERIFADII